MLGSISLVETSGTMSPRFKALMIFTILLAPGCLGVDEEIDVFYGEDIVPPRATPDFVLMDQNGDPVAFNDFLGDVVVVAFLFTRCPDVCPQVSANMAWIGNELGDDLGTEVHLLSITVDPWYDNSSVMQNYAYDRGLEWPHLSSDLETMEPVWRSFDVGLETYANDTDGDGTVDGFDLCPDTPEGEQTDADGCGVETQQSEGDVQTMHHPLYYIDHTTGTIIVDRAGNQRVYWGDFVWNADMVLDDIMALVEESA